MWQFIFHMRRDDTTIWCNDNWNIWYVIVCGAHLIQPLMQRYTWYYNRCGRVGQYIETSRGRVDNAHYYRNIGCVAYCIIIIGKVLYYNSWRSSEYMFATWLRAVNMLRLYNNKLLPYIIAWSSEYNILIIVRICNEPFRSWTVWKMELITLQW